MGEEKKCRYSWVVAIVFICCLEVCGSLVIPAQGELSQLNSQSCCIRLQPPPPPASLVSDTFPVSLPSASVLEH